jgi:hypothetical protein
VKYMYYESEITHMSVRGMLELLREWYLFLFFCLILFFVIVLSVLRRLEAYLFRIFQVTGDLFSIFGMQDLLFYDYLVRKEV